MLSPGRITLHQPVRCPAGGRLEIRGAGPGTELELAGDFRGAAAILADRAGSVTVRDLSIIGNRATLLTQKGLPPSGTRFADYYDANGIMVSNSRNIRIVGVNIRLVRSFAILASASSNIEIDSVTVDDSGTLDMRGRNNTTGGILLEEGSSDFAVRNCALRRVAGNGIWTHSTAVRNSDGLIDHNYISDVARDAIQVGHATRVRVENNRGARVGYPHEQVDLEDQANPVALDSAGNVDASSYAGNHFEEMNGHCIDLDGFHDGKVTGNSCINRKRLEDYPDLSFAITFNNANPDMQSRGVVLEGNHMAGFAYGGVFLIGSGHHVVGNQFLNMNMAHCTGDFTVARCNYLPDQPDVLRSGIYLAAKAERPAVTSGNVIRKNQISGFGMDRWCIAAAPGVRLDQNTIVENRCSPATTVAEK